MTILKNEPFYPRYIAIIPTEVRLERKERTVEELAEIRM